MLSSLRLALTALVAVGSVHAVPQAVTTGDTATNTSSKACNNSPSLCSRQYNNVTYAGAHDSAFLRDASTGNSIAGNQFKNATIALDAGVRFLQAQVHENNGTLHLCHSSCTLLDAGPLETWLATIDYWLSQNLNEVVTILLVNSDVADVSTYATIFENSGISKIAYKPQAPGLTTVWPTLQSMIDQNARVVNFITDIKPSTAAPYLLDEFTYMFETPYEITQLGGFNCTVDRPSKAAPGSTAVASGYLSLANHFKYQTLGGSILIPDADSIDTVNSAATTTAGNLGLHLQVCKAEWGKAPNFFIVDFWDKGTTIQAADNMNAVTDITGRKTSTGDGGKSGSSRKESGMMQGALVAFCAAAVLML